MDRSQEFNEIINKHLESGGESENSVLRNRKFSKKDDVVFAVDETKKSIYEFSKTFLSECTLTVRLLL